MLEWTGGVARKGRAQPRADPEAANAVVLGRGPKRPQSGVVVTGDVPTGRADLAAVQNLGARAAAGAWKLR